MFLKYRHNTARYGGTCIFLLNYLNFTTINVDVDCSEFDFELCAIKIQFDSMYIFILSVYRAPSGNFTNFIHKMDVLRTLYSPNVEFIICGDFNVDYLTDNIRKSQLNFLFNTYNLFSIVDFPTRIYKSTKSAIDNIFSDLSRLVTFTITLCLKWLI
jgi:exonuclease III